MNSTPKILRPNVFRSVIPFLGQGESFAKIVSGQLQVPDTETYISSLFAPALTPVWSTGAGTIIGLWTHWFSERRAPTFVQYYGQTTFGVRNMVFEYARTFEQLLYVHLLECFTNDDGIYDATASFMSKVGISDSNSIDKVSMESGKPEGFLGHPSFVENSPLSCFENPAFHYRGDFPHESMDLTKDTLRNSCNIEYHSGFKNMAPDLTFRDLVEKREDVPIWINAISQRPVFQQLLGDGDLLGAWMSLNSSGWMFGEAKLSIQELAQAARNHSFNVVAETWCSLPFRDNESI